MKAWLLSDAILSSAASVTSTGSTPSAIRRPSSAAESAWTASIRSPEREAGLRSIDYGVHHANRALGWQNSISLPLVNLDECNGIASVAHSNNSHARLSAQESVSATPSFDCAGQGALPAYQPCEWTATRVVRTYDLPPMEVIRCISHCLKGAGCVAGFVSVSELGTGVWLPVPLSAFWTRAGRRTTA